MREKKGFTRPSPLAVGYKGIQCVQRYVVEMQKVDVQMRDPRQFQLAPLKVHRESPGDTGAACVRARCSREPRKESSVSFSIKQWLGNSNGSTV